MILRNNPLRPGMSCLYVCFFPYLSLGSSIPVNYDLRKPSARSPIQRDSDVHHLGLQYVCVLSQMHILTRICSPSSPIVVSSPEPSPKPQPLKRQSTADSRRSSRKKAKTAEATNAVDISNISAETDVQMEDITSYVLLTAFAIST